MFDALRFALYRAITTPKGDRFTPLKVQKNLARRMNTVLGSPLCDETELARRRAARSRLRTLLGSRPGADSAARGPTAPVMIYFERNRNQRELDRIKEVLGARSIAYTLLDVTGDEATLTFVTRAARCEPDVLPVVFVADKPIGTFRDLVDADVSGALARLLEGGREAAGGVSR